METLPEIVTRRVTIPDATGAPRIVLGVDERGEPSIRLFDRHGKEQASIAVGALDLKAGPLGAENPTIAQISLGGQNDGAGINLLALSSGYGVIEVTSTPDETGSIASMEVEADQAKQQARFIVRDRGAEVQILARGETR